MLRYAYIYNSCTRTSEIHELKCEEQCVIVAGTEGGGDLPWIGKTDVEKRHEAELRLRILEIAEVRSKIVWLAENWRLLVHAVLEQHSYISLMQRPEEHLLKTYDDTVDVRADMQSAGAILEVTSLLTPSSYSHHHLSTSSCELSMLTFLFSMCAVR